MCTFFNPIVRPTKYAPLKPRPRDRAGVLVLRLMGPRVLTVKTFSLFRTSISAPFSFSLTRMTMEPFPRSTCLPAPTLTGLCNRVPRGSRHKVLPPKRESLPLSCPSLPAHHQLYVLQCGQAHVAHWLWSCHSGEFPAIRPFQFHIASRDTLADKET